MHLMRNIITQGLNVKSTVRMGTFINELEPVCEDIQPYAVVMGSQGSSETFRGKCNILPGSIGSFS